jgi:hypothetical protein
MLISANRSGIEVSDQATTTMAKDASAHNPKTTSPALSKNLSFGRRDQNQ